MNVQTAIADSNDIAAAVTRAVGTDRQKHAVPAKPVLAVWVGAEETISRTFSDAGIPDYPTEDDAVRGFMYLVHHREVVESLAAVPPSLPHEFVPDTEAARRIVEPAVAEGRRWLRSY